MRELLHRYAYQEIRLPIVEKTELFQRSIGETSDIVTKEMYTFADRNGDSLTLRPEGTASCVRAGLEHGLFHNQVQKLWYLGPMFRHERPQRGRQRQFHQIGVEAFGLAGPEIDAELLFLTARLWRELGIDNVRLELNTLGSSDARAAYRDVLVEYFSAHQDQLDDDSRIRLDKNPLRILDSKNPAMQALIAAAPTFTDHIDAESADHFARLCRLLDAEDLAYTINPRLVRGLDYYGKTVFEWITDALGAQGTVCAGGRYDGLVAHFGGSETPAIGFAIGLERLVELVNDSTLTDTSRVHVYLILADAAATDYGLRLAERLRDELPGLRLQTHHGGGSMKSQFKKADKSAAEIALILGDAELQQQQVSVKSLRSEQPQQSVDLEKLAGFLADRLNLV